VKSIRLVLTVFFLISFCSNSSTPISVSSLNDIIGFTTNKIEVSNSNWQEYIGKSNDGNFVALRVDSEIDPDGVLIVFSKEDLKNGIEEGGRVMNPLDRNVVDKMAVLGIMPLPVDILSLQKNIEPSKFSIEFNVQGDFHNSDVTKIDFTEYFTKYTSGLLPSFFVESINDEIFMFGGMGNIVKMSMVDGTVQEVKTNLNQIIQDQEYTSIVKGSDYSSRMGLRDSSFDEKNNLILITAIKKDFAKNCFTLGVLSAEFNTANLDFSWVYNIDDCYENFNSHHAGGRIKEFNGGYLLTVGDFKLPEDFKLEIGEESHLGKILFLDRDWNSDIYSSGHRNPQGLIINGETILSTEHGPFGGDELNIVLQGRNYGWPSSAYGFTYGLENIYELDHDEKYEEPIYFFTPSIGISELTIYKGSEFPRWNDFIFITSLKDMTIYTLKLDSEGTSIIHVGEIYIGERIRDITIAKDGRLVLAGDLGSLIVVNRTDKDIP
tara:strand:+ start:1245 stop:2720 length:1476 start_codon:yes stop_codon:yes gene_type:complete